MPTYGPLPNALGWRAHGGTNCAGTVLGNTYRDNSDSRLISPVFAVPSAEQNPRLRFWSWVQTYGPGDYGRVLIRTEGGVWQTLSEEDFTGPGAVWNQAVLDLSGYGGQLVELAWLFHSDASTVAAGWYVDEVTLVTGPVQAVGAQVVESFESGWGDWSVQGGGPWELGEPTSGPGSAHGGTNCVGTALGGNYPEWDVYAGAGPGYSSRLASPAFVVPGAEENPRLRFWHWYSFNVGPDYGEVQIRMGTNAWQALAHYEGHGSGVWSRPALDLSVYAGQSVQVGFVFAAADGNHWYGNVDAGWYVDEVEVVTGSIAPLVADVPESFEGGLGDWYVDAGVWEVGVPTYGPLPNALGWRAHGGTNCAGTVLGNTYRDNSDSRLISPVFAVPSAEQNPRLRFWSWVQTYGPGDYGRVLIRTEGGRGRRFRRRISRDRGRCGTRRCWI